MNAANRSSVIALYRGFIKCSRKIPPGPVRHRYVQNVYEIFALNTITTTPTMLGKILDKGYKDLDTLRKVLNQDPKAVSELLTSSSSDSNTSQIE